MRREVIGDATLILGDCVEVLAAMEPETFDSVVCDPPYGLEFMGKDWDAPWQISSKSALFGDRKSKIPGWGTTRNPTCLVCRGRLRGAKSCSCEIPQWDEDPSSTRIRQMRGFQEWCEQWAREVYRVMKPGAYLVAFGGTRTSHRMACAIEDAGFEIRDSLLWLYGTGFPKSLDVSKAIDKAAGAEREVVGSKLGLPGYRNGPTGENAVYGAGLANGDAKCAVTAPATEAARQWQGWGTALKPAHEPIILARKPLAEKTVAANVLKHGVGALNIDATRVAVTDAAYAKNCSGDRGHGDNRKRDMDFAMGCGSANETGRWPPNVLHDGSPEVLEAFARFGEKTSGKPGVMRKGTNDGATYGAESRPPGTQMTGIGDSGTAARFFPELGFHYSGKATKADRAGSKHPTVKPQSLMRWLCRLVTPPGGHVLDPFAGSGSTLQAAWREGFRATGIELTPEYFEDIQRRLRALDSRQPHLFKESAPEAVQEALI